jgi:hypothetical protein
MSDLVNANSSYIGNLSLMDAGVKVWWSIGITPK